MSRVQLTRLVHDGMLTRLAHGVYVLRGAAGMEHLELRAAWLGLEPEAMAAERLGHRHQGAVVSHASAARLHQLGDLEADRHEFTLPTRKQTRRTDVRLHRGKISADEIVTVTGLPTTTPERIIVDLLDDRHDGEHVARVLASAVRSRSIELEKLTTRLARYGSRFGMADEGEQVLNHLLELGGAADQVIADELVHSARAHNLSLSEALLDRSRSTVQALLESQTNTALFETIRTMDGSSAAAHVAAARRALRQIEGSGA